MPYKLVTGQSTAQGLSKLLHYQSSDAPPADKPKKPMARGRTVRRVAGQMNKTEARYADELETRKKRDEIVEWGFERITLKLADDTRLTLDFFVLYPDGLMELIDVKGGYWEDDAKVKIKVAAEQFFMFRFVAVFALPKKGGGGWKVVEF